VDLDGPSPGGRGRPSEARLIAVARNVCEGGLARVHCDRYVVGTVPLVGGHDVVSCGHDEPVGVCTPYRQMGNEP
jgi:hypothetical protein